MWELCLLLRCGDEVRVKHTRLRINSLHTSQPACVYDVCEGARQPSNRYFCESIRIAEMRWGTLQRSVPSKFVYILLYRISMSIISLAGKYTNHPRFLKLAVTTQSSNPGD